MLVDNFFVKDKEQWHTRKCNRGWVACSSHQRPPCGVSYRYDAAPLAFVPNDHNVEKPKPTLSIEC